MSEVSDASKKQKAATRSQQDERALNEALEWLVTLWSGEAGRAEFEACERWRRTSAAHEAAWQRVQGIDARLGAVPPGLAAPTLRGATERARRRTVLRSIAMAGGGAALAWTARDVLPWHRWTADYRTAAGEQRTLTLTDGTVVTLNTATALDVRYTGRERRLALRAGEIYVATGHEAREAREAHVPARQFIVETGQGSVQALGTRFTVRQHDTFSAVAVYEGAVAVLPREQARSQHVDAGQQTVFFDNRVDPLSPASTESASWTRGLLVAEQMRLDTFLRELGRYRPGYVRTDPAVAALRVSGVFPLADTDRVFASLQRALPLRVRYATRYWVDVGPA